MLMEPQVLHYQVVIQIFPLMAGMELLLNILSIGPYSCSLPKKYFPSKLLWFLLCVIAFRTQKIMLILVHKTSCVFCL